MRKFWLLTLPLLAVAGLTLLARSGACTSGSEGPAAIPISGLVLQGVVQDDHFYAITNKGCLLDLDLKEQRVRDLGNLGSKLLPFVDGAAGKACVASADHLLLVNLADGKVEHSLDFPHPIQGLGFAGAGRVFVLSGPEVVLVDPAGVEKVQHIVVTPPAKGIRSPNLTGHDRVGKRLYVTDDFGHNLSSVDLEEGKVLQQWQINSFSWYGSLHVAGDRAFLMGVNLSYGINNPQAECLDLKSGKVVRLSGQNFKIRIAEKEFTTSPHLGLAAGPHDTVYATMGENLCQYDDQGNEVSKTPLPKMDGGRLVGIWNGQALLASQDTLQFLKLAQPATRAE